MILRQSDPLPFSALHAKPRHVSLRGGVPGAATAGIAAIGDDGRKVVLVTIDPARRRGALGVAESGTLAEGARLALAQRLPLVVVLASSGVDVVDGLPALDVWGKAARHLTACSGLVPVVFAVLGPAVSGPALLLGMADVVVMTPDAMAYVSGPASVSQLTGLDLSPSELGGSHVHQRSTGLAALDASDPEDALAAVAELLAYLPDHADQVAPRRPATDPPDRFTPELRDLLPATATGSYDVRDVIRSVADHRELLELRARWAPQLVTALAHVDGYPVGIVANQPQAMAGTLDIAASQKGARFVAFCDAFNIALLTLVDTPGFMPGKDLEWRGMIRHGAQLVFAYGEATVPRVCVILRKAFGGAYIVMDSKLMGNDLSLAWPTAEIAVMGAQGAVQILHRREGPEEQARLVEEYRTLYLNPYLAAERGFVDQVIDPADTRRAISGALAVLASKRERLSARKHGNGPL